MAFWHWTGPGRRFSASYPNLSPCFTAGKQSKVGSCRSTRRHWKTTIVASTVYFMETHDTHQIYNVYSVSKISGNIIFDNKVPNIWLQRSQNPFTHFSIIQQRSALYDHEVLKGLCSQIKHCLDEFSPGIRTSFCFFCFASYVWFCTCWVLKGNFLYILFRFGYCSPLANQSEFSFVINRAINVNCPPLWHNKVSLQISFLQI
jgi:hypothetical protein